MEAQPPAEQLFAPALPSRSDIGVEQILDEEADTGSAAPPEGLLSPATRTHAGALDAGAAPDGDRFSQSIPEPPDAAPQATTWDEPPTPLREGTRRFLRAALGVDAADVPIYRGAAPARFVRAHVADALTADGAIVLGEQRDEDTPRQLGLLAHELIHAARTTTPRYIPPILQDATALATDEEVVAQAAEAEVIRLAEARARQSSAEPAEDADISVPAPTVPAAAEQPAQPAHGAAATARPGARALWGNLPAPWEPWPAADRTSPTGGPAAQPVRPDTQPIPPRSAGMEAPALQRAERGRSLPPQAPQSPAPPSPRSEQPAEPDLDALARQVYTALKRRLASEQRRGSR
jgi:hypothetical protein